MTAPSDNDLMDIYNSAFLSGYSSGLMAVGVDAPSAEASGRAVAHIIQSDPAHRATILRHCRLILSGADFDPSSEDIAIEPGSKAEAIDAVKREWGQR